MIDNIIAVVVRTCAYLCSWLQSRRIQVGRTRSDGLRLQVYTDTRRPQNSEEKDCVLRHSRTLKTHIITRSLGVISPAGGGSVFVLLTHTDVVVIQRQ